MAWFYSLEIVPMEDEIGYVRLARIWSRHGLQNRVFSVDAFVIRTMALQTVPQIVIERA